MGCRLCLSMDVDVAVRRVEPTVEQGSLGNAPEHEEGRLDGGQLAKQCQVVGRGPSLDHPAPSKHWASVTQVAPAGHRPVESRRSGSHPAPREFAARAPAHAVRRRAYEGRPTRPGGESVPSVG